MEKKEIEYGDWVCLKSNAEIIFRVSIVNPNETIEYKLKGDTKRHFANTSEVKLIDFSEIPENLLDYYNDYFISL